MPNNTFREAVFEFIITTDHVAETLALGAFVGTAYAVGAALTVMFGGFKA